MEKDDGFSCEEHEQRSGNTGNSKGSASAKFTSSLQHPSESASSPRFPIKLKVIPDQGEKVENVIKAQETCSLLFPLLFIEVGSDHNLLQAPMWKGVDLSLGRSALSFSKVKLFMVILDLKVQIDLGMTYGHGDQSINLLAHLNELRMHKKTKLKSTLFNICDKC